MSEQEYSGVSLPNELVVRIDKIVESGKLGYRSRAEFVTQAIRNELNKLNGNAK